jgi:acyl-CoA synthetase (AMP-forming)/AMP-acid ligase II
MTPSKRNPLHDLRLLAALLDPRVVRRLWEAGALGPSRAKGALQSLPWLVGRGPSLGLLSQINAAAQGDHMAVIDRSGELTWADLDGRANRLAHAFSTLGLVAEDRVATLLRNGRETVEVLVACQKLGIGVAPLNTWAKQRELEQILAQAQPAFLVADERHLAQVPSSPGVPPLMVVGNQQAHPEDVLEYEEVLAGQPGHQPNPLTLSRSSSSILVHTSGATRPPKAAARSAGGTDPTGLVGLLNVVPFRHDDVVLCPAPLFHSFGLLTFTVAMLLGCTLVLPDHVEPAEILRLIEDEAVSAASFVPVMVRRMVRLPKKVRSGFDPSTLRIVMTSGSALPPDLRRAAGRLFGDVLYDLYGSTEAGWIAIATPEDMATDPRTVGRPVPGVEVVILGPDGEELPPGEHGSVGVKSSMAFEGYASGERTRRRGGAIDVGDLGWFDEGGRMFVEGRADEMVVIGGEYVYPAEVESVIQAVPGVVDAAVVGIDDRQYGQVLVALVKGRVSATKVTTVCKDELASFKVPKVVEIVDEIPRTSTGKIVHKDLIGLVRARPSTGRSKRRVG